MIADVWSSDHDKGFGHSEDCGRTLRASLFFSCSKLVSNIVLSWPKFSLQIYVRLYSSSIIQVNARSVPLLRYPMCINDRSGGTEWASVFDEI
jgi:hypothetical protein